MKKLYGDDCMTKENVRCNNYCSIYSTRNVIFYKINDRIGLTHDTTEYPHDRTKFTHDRIGLIYDRIV